MAVRPSIPSLVALVFMGISSPLSAQSIEFKHPAPGEFWYGNERLSFQIKGTDTLPSGNISVAVDLIKGFQLKSWIRVTNCDLQRHHAENVSDVECRVSLPVDLQPRYIRVTLINPNDQSVLKSPEILSIPNFAPSDASAFDDSARDSEIQILENRETVDWLKDHPEELTGTIGSLPIVVTKIEDMEPPKEISILIAIDRSSSLKASPSEINKSIRALIEQLHNRTDGKVPLQFNIVVFNTEVRSVTKGFTSDLARVELALAETAKGSNRTDVNAAIDFAVRELIEQKAKSSRSNRVALAGIFVSDLSHDCQDCPSEIDDGRAAAAMIKAAQGGVPIHWVQVVGDSPNRGSLPTLTGGRTIPIAQVNELLPEYVADSLLATQRATFAPVVANDLSIERSKAIWDDFQSKVKGNATVELAALSSKGKSLHVVYRRYLPVENSKIKSALSILENSKTLPVQKADAAEEIGDVVANVGKIEDGSAVIDAEKLFNAFQNSIGTYGNMLVSSYKFPKEVVKLWKEATNLKERAGFVLAVTFKIKETADDYQSLRRYFTSVFTTLSKVYAANLLWNNGENANQEKMISLFDRINREGMGYLWAEPREPHRRFFENCARFLRDKINSAKSGARPQDQRALTLISELLNTPTETARK